MTARAGGGTGLWREPATNGKTRRRAPKSAARHDEIVDAAAALFYEKGFDATTIQDIADVVGMLKGSLYYHVASKDALLVEVLAQIHEVFTRNLEELDALQGVVLERVWAMVFRNAQANASNYVRAAVFANEFQALDPADTTRIIELRDRHDAVLRGLLAEGQETGVVCRRLDVKLTSIAILSVCNAVHRWYQPGTWTPDDIGRHYADFLVGSIACNAEDGCRHAVVDGDTIVAGLGPAPGLASG
jgi:AcrR family transcriptional regulator